MNVLMMQRERIIKVLESHKNSDLSSPDTRSIIAKQIIETIYKRHENEINQD